MEFTWKPFFLKRRAIVKRIYAKSFTFAAAVA